MSTKYFPSEACSPLCLLPEPGPVETVQGHCSVLVWDEPSAPNGIITNYSLLFLLNTGNDSGVVVTTDSSVTHFDIKSRNQFPLSPADGGSAFVKVPFGGEVYLMLPKTEGCFIVRYCTGYLMGIWSQHG